MSGANDMSSTLGEVFGTTKVASATPEDLEKQAQVEFFNGLCQEQGINIKALNDDQVEELWKVAMEMKAAEFPPNFGKKDGEEKGEKKEEKEGDKEKAKEKEAAAAKVAAAAESEFFQKKAAAEKVAEADAMGRIMAHSFVAELNKIAEKSDMPPPFGKKDEKEGKEGKDGKEKKEGEEKEAAAKASALITAFQTAKTASAATASGTTTPNFDEQAAFHAIELLKEAGINPELAYNKVNAVYVLGLSESTKLASAPDLAAGLHVRALEICEAAGFQVNWPSA